MANNNIVVDYVTKQITDMYPKLGQVITECNCIDVNIDELHTLSQKINNTVLQEPAYEFQIDSTLSRYEQLECYVELRDSYYELQKNFIILEGDIRSAARRYGL